jgi:hypothetical protein
MVNETMTTFGYPETLVHEYVLPWLLGAPRS